MWHRFQYALRTARCRFRSLSRDNQEKAKGPSRDSTWAFSSCDAGTLERRGSTAPPSSLNAAKDLCFPIFYSAAARRCSEYNGIILIMASKLYFIAWAAICIALSGLLGFISMVFMSLYLYEELTHMGERGTLEQVHQGTVGAVVWCGLIMFALATFQFFLNQKICDLLNYARTKLISGIIALLSWFILFLPSAIHAYKFYMEAH